MISFTELKSVAKEQIKGNILTFFGLSIVLGLILEASAFTGIGVALLVGPIEVGLVLFMMEVANSKKGKFGTGFGGFNYFGPSFVATLLTTIYTLLWTCLFIIPGIIAECRYAMVYYIIADNPEMSGTDAIKASKKMMEGHKWEYFCLIFSFFGWYILGAITCGLAYIYVAPYVHATKLNYYYKLKEENPISSIEE